MVIIIGHDGHLGTKQGQMQNVHLPVSWKKMGASSKYLTDGLSCFLASLGWGIVPLDVLAFLH